MALEPANRPWTCLFLGVLLLRLAKAEPSIPIAYCASINTSPNAANLSDFQTEGLCFGFCQSEWALAVVMGKSCWCSNYVPNTADQVSISNCNTPCSGYPTDLCGGNKLYAYLALSKSVSGTTDGVPQPTDSTSETPTPSVQTVTAGGTVKTVTVTPFSTATDAASSASISSTSGGGLPAGAAAGIAVGVLAAVGILAGLAFWMWRRRRNQNAAEAAFDSPSQRPSSSGMTSTPKTAGGMSENRYMMGPDGQQTGENWDNNPQNGKRRSTLMPVDPRLDPFARGLYNTQNKSRESVNSLQDNQDYSRRVHEPNRVLRATNPDPDEG